MCNLSHDVTILQAQIILGTQSDTEDLECNRFDNNYEGNLEATQQAWLQKSFCKEQKKEAAMHLRGLSCRSPAPTPPLHLSCTPQTHTPIHCLVRI